MPARITRIKGTMTNIHLKWLDSIGAATFVIDASSHVVYWNKACEVLTGLPATEVMNTQQHWRGFYDTERPCLADVVLEDNWLDNVDLYDHIEQSVHHKRGLRARNWCQTPAGLKYLIFEANAFFDDDGQLQGVVETLRDASQLMQTTLELRKLERAVEHSTAAVYITDPRGNIEYINPKYTEITGYTEQEVIGRNPSILKSGLTPEKVYKQLWQSLSEGKTWQGNIYNKRKDGSYYWSRNSMAAVRDNDDKIINFVAIQEDITTEIELQQQLENHARFDHLTSLLNRREFEIRLNDLLNYKRRKNTQHVICFIDLDQFKIVNDSGGHHAGDYLLVEVASLLKSCVRNRDAIARLGGDEFAILLKECSLDKAEKIAEKILSKIDGYRLNYEDRVYRVSASVGLYEFTSDEKDIVQIMKNVDSACYLAKEQGRNRMVVYNQNNDHGEQRDRQVEIVAAIDRALDEDRFVIYAQPIEALAQDSRGHHYELLIRMLDDNNEIVAPGLFLPVAERYFKASRIDRWMIKNTFELLMRNRSFLAATDTISINLSGQSMTDDFLLNFIVEQLDKTLVRGDKICFEITETAAISNLERAEKFIFELGKYDCRFSLDDFGSGLSSFGYLRQLPVHYLKIDGSFVKNIHKDKVNLAMVKSIKEVGQVMGKKTIAEFVENDEIKNLLYGIGIDYAQGYGIARPQPLENLIASASGSELDSKTIKRM